MPEGPEIWRAARKVGAAVEGRTAERVELHFDALRPFEKKLSGQAVEEVRPRGKAMLIRFANGLHLYSHNQLYGRWFTTKAGKTPDTTRSLRVAIHNDAHSAWLYSASDVAVLRPNQLASHPFLQKLGPDVLDQDVTAAQVFERLRSPTFARRRLTALLLDQGFLCGLGNYLRTEILFVARVTPTSRPCDLDDATLEELADACLELSRRSLRTGGITNEPDRVRALKDAGWPRARYRHFAFSRAGQSCHLCGETIERIEAGSRRLYVCPGCQTVGRR
ncbi:MAG: endonuclease VIII [Planctomycetota bacterium]|jgi:endonuclease-8